MLNLSDPICKEAYIFILFSWSSVMVFMEVLPLKISITLRPVKRHPKILFWGPISKRKFIFGVML